MGELKLESKTTSGEEIIGGLLTCGCGRTYPILGGIPRMVDMRSYSSSSDKNVSAVLTTQRSFEQEWSYFSSSDKTWGWDLNERKTLFLKEMDANQNNLPGKVLLDAGCGNGTLDLGLAAYGLEIVAMDLTNSIEKIYPNNTHPSKVHFVQGDVLKPPFKPRVFDLVYSSGVLHHTPSPQVGFVALSKTLKNEGKMYVWVYHVPPGLAGVKYRIYLTASKVTSRFPKWIQHLLYSFFSFVSIAKQNILRPSNPESKKLGHSELMVRFYDMFGQRYQSIHTPPEVFSWFRDGGFSSVKMTENRRAGFGVCGDKSPENKT